MKYKLFIDFDGTLTDVWPRYYSIFSECWGEIGLENYKNLKRRYPEDKDLLVFLGLFDAERYMQYKEHKRQCLEDPDYLALDKLLIKSESLREFVEGTDATILTIRRNKKVFLSMLDTYDLAFLKSRSQILQPNGGKVKLEWMMQNIKDRKIIMVGDSEMDLAIGEAPNSFIFIVRTGLRDPAVLKGFRISFTEIDSIHDFIRLYSKGF